MEHGHMETVNGVDELLGPNEHVVDWKCPVCGGDVIENCGPGIAIQFCTKCHWTDEDYFSSEDFM